MKTLTATFDIVTPMFIGSSDPARPEGVRPSSVKGALRFWWRALNWAHMTGADDLAKLRALHAKESQLFGVSAGDDAGGQGVFMLQVRDNVQRAVQQPFGTGFDVGILYLLGMGLGSFQGGNHCTRDALPAVPGKGFEVKLLFRPHTSKEDVQAVAAALQVFGLLGSLGRRARHGMGSVAMTALQSTGLDLPAWQAPTTVDDYVEALKERLKDALNATGQPPLSAFSDQARVEVSQQHRDMHKLLAALGREQQAYRSYGLDGQVNGAPSERRFVPDHDAMRRAATKEAVKEAPARAVFGLPHNYYFSSLYKQEYSRLTQNGRDDREAKREAKKLATVNIDYIPKNYSSGESKIKEARRASPLLLHLHRVGDEHVAVHTLLTSRFLPEDRPTVQVKPGKAQATNVPVDVKWEVLHTYLHRFEKNNPAWRKIL